MSKRMNILNVKTKYMRDYLSSALINNDLNSAMWDFDKIKSYVAKGSKFTTSRYKYALGDRWPFYKNNTYNVLEVSLRRKKTGDRLLVLQDQKTLKIHYLFISDNQSVLNMLQIGVYELTRGTLKYDKENDISYKFKLLDRYSSGDFI